MKLHALENPSNVDSSLQMRDNCGKPVKRKVFFVGLEDLSYHILSSPASLPQFVPNLGTKEHFGAQAIQEQFSYRSNDMSGSILNLLILLL